MLCHLKKYGRDVALKAGRSQLSGLKNNTYVKNLLFYQVWQAPFPVVQIQRPCQDTLRSSPRRWAGTTPSRPSISAMSIAPTSLNSSACERGTWSGSASKKSKRTDSGFPGIRQEPHCCGSWWLNCYFCFLLIWWRLFEMLIKTFIIAQLYKPKSTKTIAPAIYVPSPL